MLVKGLMNLFQKWRCLADIFAFLVWGVQAPFQRGLAQVEGAEPFSPSQRRNAFSAFLFAKLFLCACGVKEKAVFDSGEAHGYR